MVISSCKHIAFVMMDLILLSSPSCSGKGTQTWKKSGTIYDGDWKNDMRDGFGTYSIQQGGVYVKQYAGGWKNDMRDVS